MANIIPTNFLNGHTYQYMDEVHDVLVSYTHGETRVVDTAEARAHETGLRMHDDSVDNEPFQSWHFNYSRLPTGDGRSTIPFDDRVLHNGTRWARNSYARQVTSNEDKSSNKIKMMRMVGVTDAEGNFVRSTSYTGRADTRERLEEQVQFIITQEASIHGLDNIRHLRQREDGSYDYTYAVNSLTKIGKLQTPNGVDERQSFFNERALFENPDPITVDLHGLVIVVHIRPIHMHFNISKAGEVVTGAFNKSFGGRDLEEALFAEGLNALGQLYTNIGSDPTEENEKIATACLSILRTRTPLTVRERFIYVDLLQRSLGLVSVPHCRSCCDRASIAIAIGATNDRYIEDDSLVSIANYQTMTVPQMYNAISDYINSPAYRNLFLAYLCRGHQHTIVARRGIDHEGNIVANGNPSFKMWGTMATESLPPSMVTMSEWARSESLRKAVAIIASIFYIVLFPVILALMLAVGHLFLGLVSLGATMGCNTEMAKRVSRLHELPYAFTPWDLPNLVHAEIDPTHHLQETYGLFA